MKKRDILGNQANKVYLGIGSNLTNKKKNIEFAKFHLISHGIQILKSSSIYISKSWPNNNFPEYYNAILLVKTKFTLLTLFKIIKNIEKQMGRTDAPKNYPRICDIDIIDFNEKILTIIYMGDKITVPHNLMHKRNFVLLPLYEINQTWFHPKLKKNIVKLLLNLDIRDLRSIKYI